MKFIIIASIVASFSTLISQKAEWVKGKWNIEYIVKDGDTIFKHNNFEFTLDYNMELNSKLFEQIDTNAVKKLAQEKFLNTSKLFWFFEDSTFSTVAIRSGGRGNLEEIDIGNYFLSNDTLYLTNLTRNNYKSIFQLKFEEKYIFMKDTSSINNMYIKLKRIV